MYPYINESGCKSCGLCAEVCPINNTSPKNLEQPQSYALCNNSEDILRKSTSGGAFSAIAEAFCDKEYIIFGAAYNSSFQVEHTYTSNIKELDLFRGSKYVQSKIGDSFIQAKKFLETGKKVLFSGTPCQIEGLKLFIGKEYENLLTVDLICHGVPSPQLFELYKRSMEKKYNSKIKSINFRDKNKRWEPHNFTISFENSKKYSCIGIDDPYEIGFYRGITLRPSCYECPFTSINRVSDFTIGDFWGVEKIKPHMDNNKGVSLVLANTKKAISLMNNLNKFSYFEKSELSDIINNNPQLKYPTVKSTLRDMFMQDMEAGDFELLKNKYLKPRPVLRRLATMFFNKKIKAGLKRFYK